MSDQKPPTTQEILELLGKTGANAPGRAPRPLDKLFVVKSIASLVLIISLAVFISSGFPACTGHITQRSGRSSINVPISSSQRKTHTFKAFLAGLLVIAAAGVVLRPTPET